MENSKDKRISWLSIFSSLTQKITPTEAQYEILEQLAYKINERLYTHYPLEEENPIKVEETKEVCPKCGAKKIIRSGEKNGTPWRGLFCSNPECDEKPKWLKTGFDELPVIENNYPKR